MTILFLRCLIIYCSLIFLIRLTGKRQIGELQPFEFAITLLIADVAANPLGDIDTPLLQTVTVIACLVVLQGLFSFLTAKNRKLRRFICGTPCIIIEDGKLDVSKINDMMLSVDDITKILRSATANDLSKVKYAIIETGGDTSIIQEDDDIIISLIENGKILHQNISEDIPSPEEILRRMKDGGIKDIKDVFWAFSYNDEITFVKRKGLK